MNYKLANVRVFVTDWQRAIHFYAETLEMTVAYRSDEIGWAQLDTGEAHLALELVDISDPESCGLIGRFVGVSLQVADIVGTYKFLAARGVDFISPPEKQVWGGVLAHLRDPDGNILTLVSE